MHSHIAFLAKNVEDTIKQALDEEAGMKQAMGDKYQPKEIEQVKLLFAEDNPDKAVKQIEEDLEQAFRDLRSLADFGALSVENEGVAIWDCFSFMGSIEEKVEQIYSLLDAFNDLTENKKGFFYETDKQDELEE